MAKWAIVIGGKVLDDMEIRTIYVIILTINYHINQKKNL